jgi:hypothetical protein
MMRKQTSLLTSKQPGDLPRVWKRADVRVNDRTAGVPKVAFGVSLGTHDVELVWEGGRVVDVR